jgi:alpha-1,6-mannosyltransferase
MAPAVRPGPPLLAATVATGVALAATAPWPGGARLFAALALVQAGLAFAFVVPALRRGLPGGGRGLAFLLAVAALVRAPLLLAPPTLSDDVHRYVVDGRLWSTGVDAWRTPPVATPLAHGLPVNHPHLATIYPPFAEAVFTAIAAPGGGERAFRVIFALCDLATVAILARGLRRAGRGPWAAAAFALHPLAALESAGSGHAESLALLLLALAFDRAAAGRRGASVLAFAAAAGVKPLALLAAPFLARTWGRGRTAVALGLALVQYGVLAVASLGAGEASGLAAYVATWRHNDLLFGALLAAGLSAGAAKAWGAAFVLGLAAVLASRRIAPWSGYAWAAAAWLLLSPVLHPWYVLGLLVALPVLDESGPRATTGALAALVLLTYVVPGGDTPGFRVLPWEVRVWELAPVIAVLVAEAAWIGIAARRRAFLARGGERWSGKRSARDT